jgi:glycosyltransferase involved in cell wall biosynthesis
MKIVIPLLNLNKSGGIRVAIQYANGLAKKGHNVTILVPQTNNKNKFTISEDVNLIEFKFYKILPNFFFYLNLIYSFKGKINTDALVLYFSWQSVLIASLNFIPFNRSLLIIQHDDDIILGKSLSISNLFKKLFFRIIYNLPYKKISVSNWLKTHLENKYNLKSTCILNGVDLSVFNNVKSNNSVNSNDSVNNIMFIARTPEWKGLSFFIKAINKLYVTHKNINLLIVSFEKIKVQIDANYQIFLPKDDLELGKLYKSATFFVFTSTIEGFGLPPLEALANGVPVISTKCGGTNDFLINNYNSLLIENRDENELVYSMKKLIEDTNLQKKLSINGIETAYNNRIEITIDSINKFLLTNY